MLYSSHFYDKMREVIGLAILSLLFEPPPVFAAPEAAFLFDGFPLKNRR